MSAPESDMASQLQRRIEELEIRLTHQEYALQRQGEELLHLQQLTTRMSRQLADVAERLQALAAAPLTHPASEPPPPHY